MQTCVQVIKKLLNLDPSEPISHSLSPHFSSDKVPSSNQSNRICKTLLPHPPLSEFMAMQEAYRNISPSSTQKVDWVVPEPGKRLLLLDLDKTIIFYEGPTSLKIRPYLSQFLQAIQHYYTVFIFTAANMEYAQAVLKKIDGRKQKIIKGVLCRKFCMAVPGQKGKTNYVKDLRILQNCDAKDMLIVDDNIWSFCLNPENAILVRGYTGQPNDDQLQLLEEELISAAKEEDLRNFIKQKYLNSQ